MATLEIITPQAGSHVALSRAAIASPLHGRPPNLDLARLSLALARGAVVPPLPTTAKGKGSVLRSKAKASADRPLAHKAGRKGQKSVPWQAVAGGCLARRRAADGITYTIERESAATDAAAERGADGGCGPVVLHADAGGIACLATGEGRVARDRRGGHRGRKGEGEGGEEDHGRWLPLDGGCCGRGW